MSSTKKAFTLISEEEPDPQAQEPVAQKPSMFTALNAQVLLVSLRALAQRTAMELARMANNLFSAGLVGAVWVLVSRTLPEPSPLQLIAIAGFAVFCLLTDMIRRSAK